MKLNSTTLGILILLIFFGGLSIASAQDWWQTQGGNQQNQNHGGDTSDIPIQVSTLHGIVRSFDSTRLELVTDEGSTLFIETSNSRYNQSIGFAPLPGEEVTITGYVEENGIFNALTITVISTGQGYTFRDEFGHPLWSGGNGKGSGGGRP
jgi:hypothetical protein